MYVTDPQKIEHLSHFNEKCQEKRNVKQCENNGKIQVTLKIQPACGLEFKYFRTREIILYSSTENTKAYKE